MSTHLNRDLVNLKTFNEFRLLCKCVLWGMKKKGLFLYLLYPEIREKASVPFGCLLPFSKVPLC